MRQEVVCSKGKCHEVKKGGLTSFEELFESDSIVSQIEKDLWRKNLYG